VDNDDIPVGRILNRREVLAIMGTTGAAVLSACATGQSGSDVLACVVSPELTEGPYYVEPVLDRSDIRADPSTGEVKEGVLLRLLLSVSQVGSGGCTPLAGAAVEVWHCDAQGQYSGVTDPGFDTSEQAWLRGYQVTDANSSVEFTTVYPSRLVPRSSRSHPLQGAEWCGLG
jgi:protocatechuate 3,4-dioxygenase beta subunit